MLRKLAPVLEWYLSERAAVPRSDDATGDGHAEVEYDCGVLIDAYSLYEGCDARTSTRESAAGARLTVGEASYARASMRMDEWYGHCATVVLAMDAEPEDWPHERRYSSRGWCTFECVAAQMLKPPVHFLRVGHFPRAFDGSFDGIPEGNFVGAIVSGADQPGQFAAKDRFTLAKQAERARGLGGTLAACISRTQQPPIAPGAPMSARLTGKLFSLPDPDALLVISLHDQLARRGLAWRQAGCSW